MRADTVIPKDVLRAAKAAGFNKPDLYSGRRVPKPKSKVKGRPGAARRTSR